MSRCFPFPPPGYEKKARPEDLDLLKKEKQKEKKHKKEKKDKEKREGKEKKEKDRSDGKHGDKKEKKEKHRDKKKERDKDKDRSSNSDRKKLSVHSEDQNKEKTSDEKKLPGKSEGHSWEKCIQKEERANDRSSSSGEKKLAGKFSGYNGEKFAQNSHLAEDSKDSKFVHELGRGVRDEDRGVGKHLVKKSIGAEGKTKEGVVGFVDKTASPLAGVKDKNKRSDERRLDGGGVEETRFSGNDLDHSFAGSVPSRVEAIPRQIEKGEKIKEKESVDKPGTIHKDKNREKKSRGKDEDRDKEKKKGEKVKSKVEHKNLEQDNLKDSRKVDPVATVNLLPLQSSKETTNKAVAEGNLRKRKDLQNNGFLHVDETKPNKLPRPTHVHPSTDNGTIESGHTSIPLTSDGQGTASSLKLDNKERKLNGVIEAQLLSVSSIKPSSANAQGGQIDGVTKKQPHPDSKYLSQADEVSKKPPHPDSKYSSQIDEVSKKSTNLHSKEVSKKPPDPDSKYLSQIDEVSKRPPHPDSKYLSEVLLVPKMEELSDFDDQEWLFTSIESQSKKTKLASSEIYEAPQVWAHALRIESADFYALPYVIPY